MVSALQRRYGKAPRPISRDPFHLILWEQVAYLVPDEQRARAFMALKSQVGLDPKAIYDAPARTLESIARLGGSIAASDRAKRMADSAQRVLRDWNGDLRAVLRLPPPQARKALVKFAMIGEPGADKILAVTGAVRVLPLDSNALRVLARVGLVSEAKDYRTTYRGAQAVLEPMLPKDAAAIVAAGHLLRQHGQTLCRRSVPRCEQCPLRTRCAFSGL
jgi:endonuclease III